MLGTLSRRSGARLRSGAAMVAVLVLSTALAACGGSDTGGPTTLNWYINPDSSGTAPKIAAACNAQSGGRWNLAISVLPSTADGQREQIVRRLAAGDPAMDVISVDPPYTPELANAGWLYTFSEAQRAELLKDVLESPIESAVWKGKLIAAPYMANTQLLWYRKSVAEKAGVDPTAPDFTWDQMIDAAVKTGTTVAEQGKRYEGYMVWVNAMVLGAGGTILENNEAGRDATVVLDSDAGRRATEIIRKLATSPAADPGLSTADEEVSRATFQGPNGGFMLNWPYIYAAIQGNIKDGSVDPSVLPDIGWARYPRVDPNTESKPPLGGINLAINRYSKHQDLSYEAIKCLVSPEMEKMRILGAGDPIANGTVYDDPEVRKAFPMAELMRESINAAGPRPVTPYYGDVASAIQRTWHPQTTLDPNVTPGLSAELIGDVLHDRRLL